MSIRANRLVDFRGYPYITSDVMQGNLDGLIKTIGALSNNSVTFTQVDNNTQILDLSGLVTSANKGIVVTNNQVALTLNDTVGGQTAKYLEIDSTKGLTVKGIDEAIAAASTEISQVAGSPIEVTSTADQTTGKTTYEIDLTIDDTTIINSNGTLASGLTLAKLETPTSGFAASYQLQDSNGTAIGTTIDIVKDQYLKSAVFGWFTKSGDVYTPAQKGDAGAIPCLKIEVWTNTDGAANNDAVATTIYIEVSDLFNPYTAGNGLALNNSEFSAVVDASSEAVTTASGTTASVLSVGANGLKVSNIQTAIDYAVSNAQSELETAVRANKAAVETAVKVATITVNKPSYTAYSAAEVEADPTLTHLFQATLSDSASGAGDIIEVVAVYDANGNRIYPEIKFANNAYSLEADFGTGATAAETWTVKLLESISSEAFEDESSSN